ncbi:phosphodiester glycosidase family protein [Clostridium arbusti]|uniref:phosphodiester glycosidase family protein n=1 Tax=Clostridium arbusti TaxID=1137848 RepID=UPI0002898EEE|nr:phosphodiester glycosidase family protein [Clostridium arbusti]
MSNSKIGKETKDKNRNRLGKLKYSIAFIVFEIIFTFITLVFIVFYGPFNNVKKTVVGALMTSGRHQYVAKWFLSDVDINKLTNTDVANQKLGQGTEKINVNEINVEHKNDTNIERYDVDGKKFKGYMLVIHDPTRVKVGYTKNLGKEGQCTSVIAEENNAIAAINGGGFSDESSSGNSKYTGTGGKPIGILMSKGKIVSNNSGNLSQKVPTMGIDADGKLLVGNYSINDLKENKVTDAISFGPVLVLNSKPQVIDQEGGIAPRTAVGQRKDGSMLLLVIDGRQLKSAGATYEDVRTAMLQYGAVNAINLDGGSSTTMYYNGDVINNPCDAVGERYVPSVVYVEN